MLLFQRLAVDSSDDFWVSEHLFRGSTLLDSRHLAPIKAGVHGQGFLQPAGVDCLLLVIKHRPEANKDKQIEVHEYTIIIKNFNRRNSHGHHGSKHRELAQHAHSHGSHAFTHTHFTSAQLQPRGVKYQLSHYFSVHAGSFRVSIIHQTLTWTT